MTDFSRNSGPSIQRHHLKRGKKRRINTTKVIDIAGGTGSHNCVTRTANMYEHQGQRDHTDGVTPKTRR
jgi:hypothetical protein